MLKLSDLQFEYPEELLAKEPSRPSRVMWVNCVGENDPEELTIAKLIDRIPAGDVFVINDTKVLKRRVFIDDLEMLFIRSEDKLNWDVLFPASKYKVGETIQLPFGVSVSVLSKGRPQRVLSSKPLEESYFEKVAEIPLPPYIQRARNERHVKVEDNLWYQTAWADKPGSLAAPTASLHFFNEDMNKLKSNGVHVLPVTLHVSLGTFLPVMANNIEEHKMHSEFVDVPKETWDAIQRAKQNGKKVWALGTTAARSLESVAEGKLTNYEYGYYGNTDLFIMPGYQWKVVDRLMTNFHQPESTLVALVASFCNLPKVKACYRWAIDRKFRLFSYGDLTVWIK